MVEEIRELQLKGTAKEKFNIRDDNNELIGVIELNTKDTYILTRFRDAYMRIQKSIDKYSELEESSKIKSSNDSPTIEEINRVIEEMEKCESEIRDLLNYIFDSDVCDTCANGRSLFDGIDGVYRYEYILDTLLTLYDNDIRREAEKRERKIKSQKNVSKYTKHPAIK